MSELQSILPVILGLVAAYLFLPPILIYGAQRFRRDMQILPFNPKTVPGSKKMVQYFDESIAAMAEIGFECLGEYSLPDFVTNAKAVAQMYRNVTTRETAMVNSVWGIANGFVTARVQYAEFVCRFDHDEIRLHSNRQHDDAGSVFGRPARTHIPPSSNPRHWRPVSLPRTALGAPCPTGSTGAASR